MPSEICFVAVLYMYIRTRQKGLTVEKPANCFFQNKQHLLNKP